jgi:Family of unknown function (DUF6282)
MNFLGPYRQFERCMHTYCYCKWTICSSRPTDSIVTRFKQLVSDHNWFNILGLAFAIAQDTFSRFQSKQCVDKTRREHRMRYLLSRFVIKRLAWGAFYLSLLIATAHGQSNLSGVIDIHAHCDPDSMPRPIDALDLARLAKTRGMRGLVLKNHYESTAALAYIVRREVPDIEIFGGIVLNRSVGGINSSAVERMVLMKGGWGRVVWMPTFDAENQVRYSKENRPFIPVVKDGQLLPEVQQMIELVAKHQLTLETGHSSAEEGLMIVREARRQGVLHVVVTHAMAAPVRMTIPQMREAAQEGAYIEFTYNAVLGPNQVVEMADYAKAIREIGPSFCILSSDLGEIRNPLHPDGLAAFFQALLKEGFSQGEIDLMSKTNPARALGLQ